MGKYLIAATLAQISNNYNVILVPVSCYAYM